MGVTQIHILMWKIKKEIDNVKHLTLTLVSI